jgi:ADP-heptose:LPS heptosyltransferase
MASPVIPDRDVEGEPLLIFRLGSIGDTAVAMPCFRGIARAFPHHRRILLTNGLASIRASSVESVLQGTQLIHETLYYPVGASLASFGSLCRTLRRRRMRTMIYLQPRSALGPVLRDVAFFRAAGIHKIIGAPLKRAQRECRVDADSGELEFESQRLARTLAPQVPVSLSTAEFDLQLTTAERTAALNHLRFLAGTPSGLLPIAIAPGAKWAAKDWGEDNWSALLRTFAPQQRAAMIFLGAADERPLAERLSPVWPGPSLNLCGILSPREAAAVLSHCSLLLCHDSGPMHLAAAQRTPCVALFGNLNRPRRWFPHGGEHCVIYEPTGVRNISVARVAAALESRLILIRSRQSA